MTFNSSTLNFQTASARIHDCSLGVHVTFMLYRLRERHIPSKDNAPQQFISSLPMEGMTVVQRQKSSDELWLHNQFLRAKIGYDDWEKLVICSGIYLTWHLQVRLLVEIACLASAENRWGATAPSKESRSIRREVSNRHRMNHSPQVSLVLSSHWLQRDETPNL